MFAMQSQSGCGLVFAGNNTQLQFQQCQSLATASTTSTSYMIFWNLRPAPTVRNFAQTSVLPYGMRLAFEASDASIGSPVIVLDTARCMGVAVKQSMLPIYISVY